MISNKFREEKSYVICGRFLQAVECIGGPQLQALRAQTQQVTPLLELWVDAPPCQARARAREPLLARGSRARRA